MNPDGDALVRLEGRSRRRVLKGDAVQRRGATALDFGDLQSEAARQLQAVREEAARVVEAARREAAALRQQARQDGYREGCQQRDQELQRRVEAAVEQRLRTALPAVHEAAAALATQRDTCVALCEDAVLRIAAVMAGKLIARSDERRDEFCRNSVRQAVAVAAAAPEMQLRMHPEDLDRLEDWLPELLAAMACAGRVRPVADATIERGGCRIDTRYGTVDGQLSTQLARLVEEMSEQ